LTNLVGPTLRCSGSEFAELFFTTPPTTSITYSIGAYTRKRRCLTAERMSKSEVKSRETLVLYRRRVITKA